MSYWEIHKNHEPIIAGPEEFIESLWDRITMSLEEYLTLHSPDSDEDLAEFIRLWNKAEEYRIEGATYELIEVHKIKFA